MITKKDIRPIPKYILKNIKKLDLNLYPTQQGQQRFYTYFTKYKNELCSVTCVVKNRYKKWYCKQVVVHGIHTNKVWLQDIGQVCGFLKVGWFRDGFTKYKTWVDYDWDYNDDKYFPMQTVSILNLNYILTLKEYKHSAIDKYSYTDILKYLRFYEKYPQCELLVKCGLSRLATSKQILKLCSKDKKFCKWLYKNTENIKHSNVYIGSIIRAYRQNKEIKTIFQCDVFKKNLSNNHYHSALKKFLGSDEIPKFIEYIEKQNIGAHTYEDYLIACNYLGLDMTLVKNRYPHNFKFWHDIRINEMKSKKAEEDERQRKELYEKFAVISNKYLTLQRDKNENYISLIAKSPQDLVKEGEILHHCVGRMGYDQKFVREETLIFFIRAKDKPDIPLATVEYSPKTHKILQCHADHNATPKSNILDFVNKKWLPYANRKLRQITV